MDVLSLTLTIIAGLAPVPVIYLFYRNYFRLESRFTNHLEYFSYGVLLAGILFIAGMFTKGLIPHGSPVLRGFVHAALAEKAGTFILIGILTFRAKEEFTVINGVVSAMMLGLGFAALENLVYAATSHSTVLLVRFISSVPLHILSCGLMGYFLALARISGAPGKRALYVITAFAGPFLFHGTYDSLLFLGKTMPYYIPPVLVILIIIMEYVLARAQTLPSQSKLEHGTLSLEDWRSMEMEPQFERWILRSMGTGNPEAVPFFSMRLSRARIVVIAGLVLTALGSFAARWNVSSLPGCISAVEAAMLFIFLPGLYAFNLLAVGVINPRYFKNSIIRIPIIIDAVLSIDVDPSKLDDVVDTVTYDISSVNSYFKTPSPLRPGSTVRMILYSSRFSSPALEGVVVCDRHHNDDEFKGSLVRFTSRPPGFYLFLARYSLYRILRGLSFNLRLPGSRDIRRLFVRPVSVMEREYSYEAGHEVFRQGEEGEEFYLVRAGKVNIMKTLDSGEEILLTTLGRDEIFGELALLEGKTRLATARCASDCVLAVASADNLDALIKSNPVFTRRLIETIAERHFDSEHTFTRKRKRMRGDMDKRSSLMFSLMKMSLACGSGAKRGRGGGGFDYDLLAGLLNCEKEKAIALVQSVRACGDETALDGLIDRKTAADIIRAFHGYPVAGEKKKRG